MKGEHEKIQIYFCLISNKLLDIQIFKNLF